MMMTKKVSTFIFFALVLLSTRISFADDVPNADTTEGYIRCINCGGAAPVGGGSDNVSDPKNSTDILLGAPGPSLSQLKAQETGTSQGGTATKNPKVKGTPGTGEQ